ncbi:hypothetical protein B0T10DRAFT_608354 [Thelonectria olida]|uniref:Rhodopsin domain-containing protein n=1 Tax=Thelonectria olida TaxID=1576542 RepID=A0A9P8W003_9HYPO|nr:hypothetical protein B0T10DRAFT_608354 [Thelonectria olida]
MDDVTYFSNKNIAAIVLVPHAIFSVIATVFVGLRIYTSRKVTRVPWQTDEYVSIAALIANHIMIVCEGIGESVGLGSNMIAIETNFPGGVSRFLKGILALEIAYGIACPLSKMAVLAMYYRIFSSSRVIRWCGYGIGSMLVGWGVAVIVVSIFTCNPVQAFWNPTMPRTCINSSNFYIGITVPNIIFDVLTVLLPIHKIWQLQMNKEKKLALTGVFLLGGSVVLASVARLVLFCIYRPGAGASGNNISQTVIFPHTASALETCLAIIGACLPPCAPLFKRVFGRVVTSVSGDRGKSSNRLSKNVHSLVTIGRVSNRSASHPQGSNLRVDGSFERLGDGSSHDSMDDLCVDGHHLQNIRKA